MNTELISTNCALFGDVERDSIRGINWVELIVSCFPTFPIVYNEERLILVRMHLLTIRECVYTDRHFKWSVEIVFVHKSFHVTEEHQTILEFFYRDGN